MMKERPSKNRPPQILSGWKEIAKYLGKGVRTVQRYERQLGLPVRRPAGKPSGSVIATAAELDAWVGASPIREVFRLSGRDLEDEYTVTADSIKRGLAEMGRLRDQMIELKNEIGASVGILRSGVQGLQRALNQNWWRETVALPRPLPTDSTAREEELALLAAPVKHRKVS